MQLYALENYIKSGTSTYPLYVGFLKAGDLLSIAEVPNFSTKTANYDIATNVLTPPVKQWQRPLIPQNSKRITDTFNDTGEFMPNPVLVAERCIGGPTGITISPYQAPGGYTTPMKVIDLPVPQSGQSPPLWIIDGQHRITGLGDSLCKQRDNLIPVVLLLNNSGTFYTGRNLAKIFAQVTTEATPLDPLHKEWLTFAFELDKYKKNGGHHRSMEAVAYLCKSPTNHLTGNQNGFHDDIKFNDKLDSKPKFLGHQYDCADLESIINESYYGLNASQGHIEPRELASQLSDSFEILKQTVQSAPDKSVFFGKREFCHKIMIDAYVCGALTFLRECNANPTSADWKSLFNKLNFGQTDWNFQQHVISSTRWVEKSKTLAKDVFEYSFQNQALPAGVSNIWDYLSGDQLEVVMEFKHLNGNKKAIKKGIHDETLMRGTKKTIPMAGRKYFRVKSRSTNARHLEIFDAKSSAADPIRFKSSGEYLLPPKVYPNKASQDPLILTLKIIVYGGNEESITVSLSNWK